MTLQRSESERDEARRRVASLEAALRGAESGERRALRERNEARADGERLRAQLEEARSDANEYRAALLPESMRRAAADALLSRLRKSTWQTSDLALPRDVRDYFSAQPAAPDPTESASPAKTHGALYHGEWVPQAPTRTEHEHEPGCRYEQELPAIDPEDCPRCRAELARREANPHA